MTIGYMTVANGHKPKKSEEIAFHPNYRQPYPQFVIGRLNEEDKDIEPTTEDSTGKDILSKKAFIIGGGAEEWEGTNATYNRKNVASIDYNGNMELAGSIILTSTNGNKKMKLSLNNDGELIFENI
jgi:hypothetical protein